MLRLYKVNILKKKIKCCIAEKLCYIAEKSCDLHFSMYNTVWI